jgi:hypothetical protein
LRKKTENGLLFGVLLYRLLSFLSKIGKNNDTGFPAFVPVQGRSGAFYYEGEK